MPLDSLVPLPKALLIQEVHILYVFLIISISFSSFFSCFFCSCPFFLFVLFAEVWWWWYLLTRRSEDHKFGYRLIQVNGKLRPSSEYWRTSEIVLFTISTLLENALVCLFLSHHLFSYPTTSPSFKVVLLFQLMYLCLRAFTLYIYSIYVGTI